MIRILPGMGTLFLRKITSSGTTVMVFRSMKGQGWQGGVIIREVDDDRSTCSAKLATLLVPTGLALSPTLAMLVKLGADSTAAGMVFLVLVVWSATQAGIWLRFT